MTRLFFTAALAAIAAACSQASPDQYKALGPAPVYGESNGVFYDATNDRLALFVNDTEVGYIDSSGNVTMDGTITEGAQALADDTSTTYGTGSDSIIQYAASAQAPDSLFIGVGSDSRQLIIAETADVSTDLTIPVATNPTLNIHSADATDASDYLLAYMDQTNGVIDVGQGSIYLGSTVIAESNLTVGIGAAGIDYTVVVDGETADGTITWMEDESQWKFSNDIDLDGGAGCIDTQTSGDSTMVVKDADSTAFCFGATGALDLACLDTTDASPSLDVKGVVGQVGFHLDAGTGLFDETVALNAGFTSSVTAADAITLSGAAPTMTMKDNEAAAFSIKSSGTGADWIVFDTTTNAEELTIKGASAGVSSFRVDVGKAVFDEAVQMDAGFTSAVTGADVMTCTGNAPTITLADNKAAALAIKTSGTAADWIVFDSTTNAEELTIKGASAGVSAFRVDTGIAIFDEKAQLDAGFTSAVTAADAITLTGAAPTMTLKDNEAAAFNINSSGTANFLLFDTTTNAEEININGNVGVSTFRVDTGVATFDEQMVCSDGADMNGDILAGGGAGALTFDAASSSIVCMDDSATGLVMGAAGATTMITLDTQNNAENVLLGNGFIVDTTTQTAAVSLDKSDCGTWQFLGDVMDGDTIDLPATVAGCVMNFMFTGTDNGALIDISPAAADAIHGSCYEETGDTLVQFSGADNTDIGLTKATSNTGDYITLIGDGVEGWYVAGCAGIWANN